MSLNNSSSTVRRPFQVSRARLGPCHMVNWRRAVGPCWSLLACSPNTEPQAVPVVDAAEAAAETGPDVTEAGPVCHEPGVGSTWAAWPMPDPLAPSYDVSSSEVVVDTSTGLMWERTVGPDALSWDRAKARCACVSTGGYHDWRLPMRIELVSIVDFTKSDPAIDGDAFPSTPSDYFWTSSPVATSADAAWYLYFFDGNTHSMAKDTPYRARCVRTNASAVATSPSFTIAVDGTVVDARSKLVWQRDAEANGLAWADAKAYCETLPLAGGGFRLPNMKELQTLVDEGAVDPAVDLDAFPGAPSESFWTATPLAGGATEAWFVNFYNGVAYTSLVDHTYRARCVR
jgi:hypothetical protein